MLTKALAGQWFNQCIDLLDQAKRLENELCAVASGTARYLDDPQHGSSLRSFSRDASSAANAATDLYATVKKMTNKSGELYQTISYPD